ncbi:AAA family ATPase [Methanococcus maripaludis]|uniref:Recombination protein F n=1 Tax=Methanococcus maripaludis TaxID=39152 RepID=A0A2L1CA95_METMI|nr:AAA family ATPase [Methanococcus maripaludis]AVB76297.1 recombination protein F [Methanococcus maripaludis]
MLELKEIHIKNFRSIKDQIIRIPTSDNKYTMFFGVNGSGKSNILKSISVFDKPKTLNYVKDCNMEAQENNENIMFTYKFWLNSDDRINILTKISSIIPKNLASAISISGVNVILVKKPDNSETAVTYNLLTTYPDLSDYRINPTSNNHIINKNDVPAENSPNYISISKEKISQLVQNAVLEDLKKAIPKFIFWESSEKYLIGQPINLVNFKQNPNISVPLKNIFYLAGYEKNMNSILDQIMNKESARDNYESKLSDVATAHIQQLWPEHKIKIKVRLESTTCTVLTYDEDTPYRKMEMTERSDGFKQFMSILLNLSVQNKIESLKNNVIIIDEPEVHLHPSGVEYLRDELLNISKNNVVFLSTHSIFMVKKDLKNHLIVSKKNGNTIIEEIDVNFPIKEEVIYRALGTSLKNILGNNILVFEGPNDRKLYETFVKQVFDQKIINEVRCTDAGGTPEVLKWVKFFNTDIVPGFVVLDSDTAGRRVIEDVKEQNPEFMDNIFEILDLVKLKKNVATTEDLFPTDILDNAGSEIWGDGFKTPVDMPVLEYAKRFKTEKKSGSTDDFNEYKKKINELVIEDLKEINDKKKILEKYEVYNNFIQELHNKLDI